MKKPKIIQGNKISEFFRSIIEKGNQIQLEEKFRKKFLDAELALVGHKVHLTPEFLVKFTLI